MLALERPAFQLATLLVSDPSIGEEIVQEAFVRVWQSPRTPRELPEFRPWLYRTIVNLARDQHRRRIRWANLRLPARASVDPAHVTERAMEASIVDLALQSLDPPEREAVYLRFFEDASFDEVGRIIGKREGTARVLVHRALRKLRSRLTADGMAPQGSGSGA
jgi:RNA polymerase sigma-70 factor (ECF subfamily)